MLVLSRRESEKVLFPHLGITVEVLKIKGNCIRLGIDAPPEMEVIREELASQPRSKNAANSRVDFGKLNETIRERLHSAARDLHDLHKQLENGDATEAEANIFRIFGELQSVDDDVALMPGVKPPTHTKASKRALLVDDNRNESKLLEGFLRCRNFEVAVAGDGADAMHYLSHNESPDIVLLDMQMPKFDGRWTINQIRGKRRFDGLRVFAVSGIHPSEYGIQMGPEGVNRWFRKPINPESLVFQMDSDTGSAPPEPIQV